MASVPAPRRLLGPGERALTRVATSLYWRWLKWPAPRWHAQRFATLDLAGHRVKFVNPMSRQDFWWTWEVWGGVWEPHVIRFLASALRPGDVFLDVGAYVGPYSLLASRLVAPAGRVYAFEPDPIARGALERNVDANSASNVDVLAEAVSDRSGREWLSERGEEPRFGNSESVVSPNGGRLPVQTVTLDEFCAARSLQPAVVKIDVEGAESRVVAGARRVLTGARHVVLEFHPKQLAEQGSDPPRLMRELFGLTDSITVLDVRDGPRPPVLQLEQGDVPQRNATLAFSVRPPSSEEAAR